MRVLVSIAMALLIAILVVTAQLRLGLDIIRAHDAPE
jgi:hypothetical protein